MKPAPWGDDQALVNYRQIRDRVRPGDIFSFRGTGLVSRLILQFSSRSHVAGVIGCPDDCQGRCLVAEAAEGEVNTRYLSERIREYRGEVYWHALKPALNCFRDRISANLWLLVGRHYDRKGLLANVFRLIPIDADELICSEAIEWATLTGGPVTVDGKERTADPGIPVAIQRKLVEKSYCTDLQKKLMAQVWANKTLRPGEYALLPFYAPEVRIK